ncbi:hypothetical protein ACWDYH_35790 [Nocardia goodfellowii]
MAMRVLGIFGKGGPVSAKDRNLRTEVFNSRKGKPLASIRALGIDPGPKLPFREFQIIRPVRTDQAA